MAGIGEASAIIGVAQIGIQLAQVLSGVIDDYKEAKDDIGRLTDEINTAAFCLKQLGELAESKRMTGGKTGHGMMEATKLSERCRSNFALIRSVLKKDTASVDETSAPNRDELDLTRFSRMTWAVHTKARLAGPRQELDRLKSNLTLAFVTHMAIVAKAADDKGEELYYRQQISDNLRRKKWAEKQYEDSLKRQRASRFPTKTQSSKTASSTVKGSFTEGDVEYWKEIVDYQNEKMRKEAELSKRREQMIYEAEQKHQTQQEEISRKAVIDAFLVAREIEDKKAAVEEEQRRLAEENRKREVEVEKQLAAEVAVEEHIRQELEHKAEMERQQEMREAIIKDHEAKLQHEAETVEKRRQVLREQLKAANLPEDQIDLVIDKVEPQTRQLQLSGPHGPSQSPLVSSSPTPSEVQLQMSRKDTGTSRFWRGLGRSKDRKEKVQKVAESWLSQEVLLEAWSVQDTFPYSAYLPLHPSLLAGHLGERLVESHQVEAWHDCKGLSTSLQIRIGNLVLSRSAETGRRWELVSIDPVKRRVQTSLLRHVEEIFRVQVILCQRQAVDGAHVGNVPPTMGPRLGGNALPGEVRAEAHDRLEQASPQMNLPDELASIGSGSGRATIATAPGRTSIDTVLSAGNDFRPGKEEHVFRRGSLEERGIQAINPGQPRRHARIKHWYRPNDYESSDSFGSGGPISIHPRHDFSRSIRIGDRSHDRRPAQFHQPESTAHDPIVLKASSDDGRPPLVDDDRGHTRDGHHGSSRPMRVDDRSRDNHPARYRRSESARGPVVLRAGSDDGYRSPSRLGESPPRPLIINNNIRLPHMPATTTPLPPPSRTHSITSPQEYERRRSDNSRANSMHGPERYRTHLSESLSAPDSVMSAASRGSRNWPFVYTPRDDVETAPKFLHHNHLHTSVRHEPTNLRYDRPHRGHHDNGYTDSYDDDVYGFNDSSQDREARPPQAFEVQARELERIEQEIRQQVEQKLQARERESLERDYVLWERQESNLRQAQAERKRQLSRGRPGGMRRRETPVDLSARRTAIPERRVVKFSSPRASDIHSDRAWSSELSIASTDGEPALRDNWDSPSENETDQGIDRRSVTSDPRNDYEVDEDEDAMIEKQLVLYTGPPNHDASESDNYLDNGPSLNGESDYARHGHAQMSNADARGGHGSQTSFTGEAFHTEPDLIDET